MHAVDRDRRDVADDQIADVDDIDAARTATRGEVGEGYFQGIAVGAHGADAAVEGGELGGGGDHFRQGIARIENTAEGGEHRDIALGGDQAGERHVGKRLVPNIAIGSVRQGAVDHRQGAERRVDIDGAAAEGDDIGRLNDVIQGQHGYVAVTGDQ